MNEYGCLPADADAEKEADAAPIQQGSRSLQGWLTDRLPTARVLYERHLRHYYVPKTLNVWYVFGAPALLVLGMQVLTGLALAMHYKPDVLQAFASVEHIMRDVPSGALIRYAHSTGASSIFVLLYLHIARGLLYGSYRKPRELVWLIGCALFVLVMAEAFMGHLLPWGQMSYWGAQVGINLFATIPGIGPDLAVLIRGGHEVGDATLGRFFALHVIGIPLLILGLAVLHVVALRDVGPSNPDGIDLEQGPRGNRWSAMAPVDTVPFRPYYTVRDIFAAGVFMTVFLAVVLFTPEMGGYFLEHDNFIPANPLATPQHIAPMWYFRPFYSILRSVTANITTGAALIVLFAAGWAILSHKVASRARWPLLGAALLLALWLGLIPGLLEWSRAPAWMVQGWERTARLPQGIAVLGRLWWLLCMGIDPGFWGVAALAASVLVLCALPWLDRSPVLSIRYRPWWHRAVYGLFAGVFLLLGILGGLPSEPVGAALAPLGATLYFAFFLLMPWWSRKGPFRTVPQRLTGPSRSVAGKKEAQSP